MSDPLWPQGLQHVRPPCPLPTLGVHSNSRPLSWWCHPTTSSLVIPFSSCLQSFPASRSFQMSQFLASGGQDIGVSASTSVLPMNIQDWFPLGWTSYSPWISLDLLAVQGTLKSVLQHHNSKASILQRSAFFIVQLSHPYMNTGKTIALTRWTFVESESEVAQSHLTLCDPVVCSLPGSSIHGIFQARVMEWVAISFSRGSSQPTGQTHVSHIAGRHFTVWATLCCQGNISAF